jgi:hypothetical protein
MNVPRRLLPVASVSVVFITMLLENGAGAGPPQSRIKCGPATRVDRSAPIGRAVPLGDVLWLGVYPYDPGYPTKVVVMARMRLEHPIAIQGWSCATGARLRFWYRESLPFANLPVRAEELRAKGSLRVTFGPWPRRASRGGYFMFWRAGSWKVVAYDGRRTIGSAVIRTTER